jgi:hypothetical protein
MRLAALHLGADHLLDHIAPLCHFLDMPLYVEDPSLAKKYYPQIHTIACPNFEKNWSALSHQADVLFRCGYWPPTLKAMFRDLFHKDMRFVFCPHGQSDKGLSSKLLAPYAEQEMVLFYGPLMQEMLQSIGIKTRNCSIIGNYRFEFYKQHRSFYDHLVANTIFAHLTPSKPTLLYAPTWLDIENSSSFFIFGKKLIEDAPNAWNVIIKPHPLLEDREPGQYHSLIARAKDKSNVFVLEKFPLIYPLLARTDVYLGDASSIGYDFLVFERPMFFLPSDHFGRLRSCGKTIDAKNPYASIESNLKQMDLYKPQQRSLARFAFKRAQNWEKQLLHALRRQNKDNA